MTEEYGNKIERVKTYVQGFDEEMGGGIPAGHIVLVSGTAGTMKSSITFSILYNEALNGKNSLYLTLEQSQQSLLNHMSNMGFDLSKINLITMDDISKVHETISQIENSKGSLVITDLGAIRKQIKSMKDGPSGDWLNVIKNILIKLKKKTNLKCFVLDSLSAMYVLSDFKDPRTELFHLFEFFRDLEVTTFLISEMPLDKSKYSEYDIEDFLSDAIIHVELAPRMRKVDRNISVVKMRGTNCNNDIFTLEFKNGKFYALYGGKTPLV
ncbi:hypothetical protein HQ529_00600 [Candidatus Woesearchaeota archaeon]|nr:hypothetical protein [Candidatus Woesearchaeota archaeon]